MGGPAANRFRRELVFRGVALVLGVAGGVLAMELVARLVLTDFYRCDAALGWTFEPGQAGLELDRKFEYALRAHINAAGYHDADHTLAKPPGTLRIVVLGDSMLAGLQVPLERTLARQLETRLDHARRGGSPIEVVNCATDGYGTAQAWLMFHERCRAYQPDLVLLGFFAFNDVLDNYWGARSLNHPLARKCGRPYFELRDGRLTPVQDALPGVGPGALAGVDPLLRRSYLYQLLAPPQEYGDEGPKFRDHDVFLRDYSPEQEAAWQVTEALLLALGEDVRKSGGHFGVLVVPSRFEVYPSYAEFRRLAQMDLGRPQRILDDFLAEKQLPHLDLMPGIRAAAERDGGVPLYFRTDAHLTLAGNDVASQLVADWVVAHCEALGLGGACAGR